MFTKIAAWFAAPIVSLLCKDERFLASVAGEIDMSELAREFDVSDIAYEIDVSDIAREVDMDEVIEQIVNNDDCINYTALAKALIRELGAANKVECRPSAT